MPEFTRYAYLQTLISIYSTRLLTQQQFIHLLKQPLEEILLSLEKKGLENIIIKLSQSKFKLLPAGNMDNLFLAVLLKDAQAIIHSISGFEREFLVYWMRRFELQNIKTIIRGKSLRRPVDKISAELTQLGEFSILPVDELLKADNIQDILKQLSATAYSSIARYGSANLEHKADVFTIETTINHEYFAGLHKRFRMLHKNEQNFMKSILGKMIDQTNLIWLLRYRLFYGLSSSHTYFLLAPGGRYLNSNNLVQLCKIRKLDQLYDLLPNGIGSLIDGLDSIHQIELSLEKDIIRVASVILKATKFSMTNAFAYLLLREKQLSQLHALFKGKLLYLSDSEIAYAVGEHL